MAQKFELLSEKKNPLLKRKELEFDFDHSLEGTPKSLDLRKKIAAKLTEDISKVYIKQMIGQAGQNKTRLIVHVYDDPKIALKIEPEYIIKRNEIKEEKEDTEKSNNEEVKAK